MKRKTSVLRGLNDIRESYILESEIPAANAAWANAESKPTPKETWRRVVSSGWFAAAVCAVVAFGTLGGIIMAGHLAADPTPNPPVGTVVPNNTIMNETETETEAKIEISFTEGLEFAPAEGEESYCSVVGIGVATDRILRIPETSPDGLTVKYIGSNAFRDNTRITEVILPDTVESIQPYAFENCSNLKKVVLGKNFKEVMARAFSNCTKLVDINLTHDHEVWTYAMARTLWAEQQTEEFMIYGGHLIGYLGNDHDVIIPDGVLYIEGGSFDGNSRITSVTIPEGCQRIIGSPFSNCTSLQKVTIPSSLFHIDAGAFGWCTSLESINAPGVTTVAYKAFTGCTSLTSVNMPSLQYIYVEAFSNCTSLSSVVLSDDVLYYAESAFLNTALTEITIPASTIRMDSNAFASCADLIRAEILSPMVGDGCFSSCKALKEIVLHDGVQTIGTDIFKDCAALERIVIPTTVTEIGTVSAIPSENLVIEYAGTAEDWANISMDEQTAELLFPHVQLITAE